MKYSNLRPPLSRTELLDLRERTEAVKNSAAAGAAFDVGNLLRSFAERERPRFYGCVDPEQSGKLRAVAEAAPAAAAACLKLALIDQLAALAEREGVAGYPGPIQEQFEIHLALMRRSLESGPESYFSLSNDLYLKDLAIAGERMAPAGAQLLQTFAGIPRSLLWRGGAGQALAFTAFLTKLRALAPLFEMHSDARRMAEFTPAGWQRFYVRAAELLRARPSIRGLVGASWWHDPAVGRLSKHMAFLNEMPMRHGARAFRYQADDYARELALLRSPERQRAYDSGEYLPTVYLLIWTREDVLRWAEAEDAAR